MYNAIFFFTLKYEKQLADFRNSPMKLCFCLIGRICGEGDRLDRCCHLDL